MTTKLTSSRLSEAADIAEGVVGELRLMARWSRYESSGARDFYAGTIEERRIDAISDLRAALILLGDTPFDGRAVQPADADGFAKERA